ncbi:permease-related [Anaeramoeba ignava]|uniref:Permease-related n=1 Tax=Anaeramoeba ignava TaxID=1746090 RepID=A0A9Q0R671_ANAIG|nr:permease-related [Anaeramoeba ignava]
MQTRNKFGWFQVLQIISAIIISLLCGAPNAFDKISSKIQNTEHYNDGFIQVLTSLEMLGLYFTIPAGFLHDKFGAKIASLIGGVCAVFSFLMATFIQTKASITFFFTLAGFGLGTGFICSLGTALKVSPLKYLGINMSLVGTAMSLSMGLVVSLYSLYDKVSGCSGDSCWKKEKQIQNLNLIKIRKIKIRKIKKKIKKMIKKMKKKMKKKMIKKMIMKMKMKMIKKMIKENDNEKEKLLSICVDEIEIIEEKKEDKASFKESLQILKNRLFWIYAISFFTGVGVGVFVIADVNLIWKSYNSSFDLTDLILTLFSVANATGSFLSGVFSDLLKKKNHRREEYLSLIMFISSVILLILGILTAVSKKGKTIDVFRCIFLIYVGFIFGTTLVLIPTMVGESFGQKNFGIHLGFLQIFSSTAAMAIPSISSGINNKTGHYFTLMFIFSGLTLISSLSLLIKPKA